MSYRGTLVSCGVRSIATRFKLDDGIASRKSQLVGVQRPMRIGAEEGRKPLVLLQHASEDRDRAIASGLDALIKEERKKAEKAKKRKSKPESGRDDDEDDPPLVGAPVGT